MNINKEFACVKHKCVMPCNCYGRSLMALEQAADALAKAAKISTAVSVSHDSGREETRPVEVWEKEFLDLKEALDAYEKVRNAQ